MSERGFAGCPPGVPFMNNAEALWGYDLKMGGPATALSLFFLLALIITAQLIHARNRNTKFMITLVVAALAGGGGYAAAVHTVKGDCKEDIFDAFLASQVLILIVPNFIEATMYTTASKGSAFGRVPRQHFWMRPAFLTWFYTASDVATIVVQAVGVGIWGSARSGDSEDAAEAAAAGAWIVVAGLIAQIASQAVFALEVVYIQWRMDREYANRPETRALFFSVYWIWGFLQIRNIFRLVSFIQRAADAEEQGGAGGAAEIQPAFFTLEPLQMVLAVAMSAIFPPGYLLPKGSARKVEHIEGKVCSADGVMPQDLEKGGEAVKGEGDGDLFAPAEVPPCMQPILRPLVALPWLGRLF